MKAAFSVQTTYIIIARTSPRHPTARFLRLTMNLEKVIKHFSDPAFAVPSEPKWLSGFYLCAHNHTRHPITCIVSFKAMLRIMMRLMPS